MAGMLSMVGTPIGNLQDASPRVVSTLDAADVVLCEDTRVTGKLMAAFGLHTHLERCDENVIEQRVPTVLDRLRAGEHVAFVSDAGMPGVSDPGQRLVDAALDEGLAVEVIPGPSAVTCALVASGLASEHFFFEGFLPRRKSAQVTRLRELALVPGTIVCYESQLPPGAQIGLPLEGPFARRTEGGLLRSLLASTGRHFCAVRMGTPSCSRLPSTGGHFCAAD